jgi:hypothetical protein
MVATTTIPRRLEARHQNPGNIRNEPAINHAVRLIHAVCGLAGSATLIHDIRADLRADKVQAAIRNHDPSRSGSTPGSSIQRFRSRFRVSSNTQFGSIAAEAGLMCAMAIASMIEKRIGIAECVRCVTGSCCGRLLKGR